MVHQSKTQLNIRACLEHNMKLLRNLDKSLTVSFGSFTVPEMRNAEGQV